MGKNEKHKLGQPGMKVKQIIPQVILTVDPNNANQLQIIANFADWDKVESMLIDALRGAWDQRTKEKQSLIKIPKQQISLSGL